MKDKPVLLCNTSVIADDLGMFAGLDIFPEVKQILWRNRDDHAMRGIFWQARGRNGIDWVSDGTERIAALPSRMFRFFRNGVTSRRNSLIGKYLQGLVLIPQDALCINIGANIGEVAITLAECGATVLAIEPDPNVVPLLRANAAGRTIEVIPVAAWNADGHLAMCIASETADTSAFWNAPASDGAMLPCRRIDTLIAERSIARVHLIIGDAEGAEPEALEGARETLAVTDYVSIRAGAERCGERTLERCEALLTGAGFDIIYREAEGFCTLIAKNKGAQCA